MVDKKALTENVASLLLVQAANYILPLVTFPYLVRMLGIGNFGLMSFIFAFAQYFVIIIDYGFNLTATRQISIHRNDRDRVSRIFCVVMSVKTIFLLVSVGVFFSLVLLVPKFSANAVLYAISFLAVIGNYLFPIWFLQGIEKIKIMSIMNLMTRIISTLCIFSFVKQPSDLLLAVTIQSSGVVLAGMASLVYIAIVFPVRINLPAVSDIRASLKDGWAVFVTILSSTLMSNTNVFILGIFCNNTAVGYFSIAEKIVRAFINLVNPVSVAIFPITSKLLSESVHTGVEFLRKVLRYCVPVYMGFALLLFLGAGTMVRLIAGEYSAPIIIMIKIMAILPLTIFIDNIYGTQLLVNIGKSTAFMKAVLIPGVISLVCAVIFVPLWKGLATSIIFLLSELGVLGMMMFYTRRADVFLIRENVL